MIGPLPQNLCGIFFIPVVLTCTTGVPQEYHRITTGNFKTYMYHRITTEPVWYIFHSCGNFCGTHLYNRGTTEVPQDIFVPQDYHTVIGPLPQNLCGIFFIPVVIPHRFCGNPVVHVSFKISCGNSVVLLWYPCCTSEYHRNEKYFCGTHLYNRGTTQVPQSTTQVPQSTTGTFW